MQSSITPEEIAALQRDPARLLAEIQRYTQIRDDAESKLRAVGDEDGARHLREVAEGELHKARLRVEEADKEAETIIAAAKKDGGDIVARAQAAAEKLLSEHSAQAADRVIAAEQAHQAATASLASAEARFAEANEKHAQAQAAIERNSKAAQAHEQAAQRLTVARQRLSSLVKAMAEIVGDAS